MAINGTLVVREHRTDSGGAVVLQGNVAVLERIAELLDLPDDAVINTRLDSAALGIWGEHLAAYEELKRSGVIRLHP